MQDIDIFIALNRFGLGGSFVTEHGLVDNPKNWVARQISRDQKVPQSLSQFRSSADILKEIQVARKNGPDQLRDVTRAAYKADYQSEILARTLEMARSQQPFRERMVLFWSNHFTVSTSKRLIGPATPAFEREAIRPHIFGQFSDLLKAVIRHPVMINYLDNHVSMGDVSRVGKRQVRKNKGSKTLNENLAREILELHTLGVTGGYSQQDVIALANVISGWSHGGIRLGKKDTWDIHGGFEFREEFHQPGTKKILGKSYEEDGEGEGLHVLEDLAIHPSTAKFIATKLARHFISDNPPQNAINRLAQLFMQTGGDLKVISEALIELEEVWHDPLPKIKTPYELVVSVHRTFSDSKMRKREISEPLRELAHVPFSAASPAGWPDTGNLWLSPEALMRRIEWLRRFAAKIQIREDPRDILENTIGAVSKDETRLWVERSPSPDAAVALILASAEFQRR
jgi:uncharacterized protein (DUF1800 family)